MRKNQIKAGEYLVRVLTPSLVQFRKKDCPAAATDRFPLHSCREPFEVTVTEKPSKKSIRTRDIELVCDTDSTTSWPFTLRIFATGTVITDLTVPDEMNLGGVPEGLDNKAGKAPIPDGLLSRRGWAVASQVDDLRQLTLGIHSDNLFVFAYGNDYYKGLADLTFLTGTIPFVPKWSLGSWFSQFYPYAEADYKKIVERYRTEKIPLDVLICDMNWHTDGWYGTRYNTGMFPDMPGFIQWVHENNLRIGFNHHPGAIAKEDPRLDTFLKTVGKTEAELHKEGKALSEKAQRRVNLHSAIPFDFMDGNSERFDAYYDFFLQPLMDDGLDLHWIDTNVGGMHPDIFARYLTRTEASTGQRGVILARQSEGSLLNHRTPLAFSGDEWMMWKALKEEIQVMIGGQNNGILWSHDIWGFKPNRHGEDPPTVEKAIRWIQFGALSPSLRLHSGHADRYREQNLPEWMISRQFWEWGEDVLEAGRNCLQLRNALMPYIYTHMEKLHSQSRPVFKGMYFAYPDMEEAYALPCQYMVGDDLLCAPIDAPSGNGIEGMGLKDVWFPPGEWIDYFTGERVDGGKISRVAKSIQEFPLYVKAGAIIPTAAYKDRLVEPDQSLRIRIFLSDTVARSQFILYEDDGVSFDYRDGKFATTEINYTKTDQQLKCIIHPTKGCFDTQADARDYTLEIQNCPAVTAVRLNGADRSATDFVYNETNRLLTVTSQKTDIRKEHVLVAYFFRNAQATSICSNSK